MIVLSYEVRMYAENNTTSADVYPRVVLEANRSGFSAARECVANASIRECRTCRRATVVFNIVIAKTKVRECRIKSRGYVN